MGTAPFPVDTSILLATYNGATYLKEQLDSIASQSHQGWQILIADDGSSDDTLKVITDFSERHPGRVRLLHTSSTGSARNNFLRLLQCDAGTQYYALCDQDDIWNSEKLATLRETCAQAEKCYPDTPILAFSDLEVVDENRSEKSHSFMHSMRSNANELSTRNLLTENIIPGCSMFFNDRLALLHRTIDPTPEHIIMHDWWLALLASTAGQLCYVKQPMIEYRQHPKNTLGAIDRRSVAFALTKLLNKNVQSARETWQQAEELAIKGSPFIPEASLRIVKTYASLSGVGKAKRVWLIIRHGIYKQGVARKAFQLLHA